MFPLTPKFKGLSNHGSETSHHPLRPRRSRLEGRARHAGSAGRVHASHHPRALTCDPTSSQTSQSAQCTRHLSTMGLNNKAVLESKRFSVAMLLILYRDDDPPSDSPFQDSHEVCSCRAKDYVKLLRDMTSRPTGHDKSQKSGRRLDGELPRTKVFIFPTQLSDGRRQCGHLESQCKNAYASKMMENALAAETSTSWKGMPQSGSRTPRHSPRASRKTRWKNLCN